MSDLISRSALMREFADFVRASNNSDFADVPTWNDAVSLLGSAPTIEAEPIKHGTWWHYEGTLTCSVCHTEIYDDIMDLLGDDVPRYCPDCGAKMDEVEE